MVFKIVRAGRKLRELHKAVEDEKEMHKYASKRNAKKIHPIAEDIDILKAEIDRLRFSREADVIYDIFADRENKSDEKAEETPETSPPFISVEDIMLDPERWSGKNVIIDGEMEFYSKNRKGENWHIFTDRTGVVTAVSERMHMYGPGTLFGVARHTHTGRNVFIEIKKFRSADR